MESTTDSDVLTRLKIIVLGDTNVGKSSLILRFTRNKFNLNSPYTIGVDHAYKCITHKGQKVGLVIWDTAGQERFRTITHTYYRNTHGVILVYDTSSMESFNKLEQWMDELSVYCNLSDVVIMVVANKIDLPERQVTTTDGLLFARRYKTLYTECSAKTAIHVATCFNELVEKIMDNPKLWQRNSTDCMTIVASDLKKPEPQESSYCSCSLI